MADKITSTQRSKMMSAVKGKNTKPEIVIRKILYSAGYRYRLHVKNVSGNPDIVIKKLKTAIFINGCFWHGHDCHLFTIPKTRSDFWKQKIDSNTKRDKGNLEKLLNDGWKIIIVWGCSMKGKMKIDNIRLSQLLLEALMGADKIVEIDGIEK